MNPPPSRSTTPRAVIKEPVRGALSGGQFEIWMADQLSDDAGLSNTVVGVQVDPSLEEGAIAAAVAAVIRQQPGMRTVQDVVSGRPDPSR